MKLVEEYMGTLCAVFETFFANLKLLRRKRFSYVYVQAQRQIPNIWKRLTIIIRQAEMDLVIFGGAKYQYRCFNSIEDQKTSLNSRKKNQ